MSKVKMRCTVCGKWFQSANAKEVTCPDCVQKARKEKMAAKNTPQLTNKPIGAGNITASSTSRAPVPPPKPKQHIQSGTNQWLDNLEDVKVGQPEQPPVRPKMPSSPVQRDQSRTASDAAFARPGQGTAGSLDSTRPHTHHRDEHDRGPASGFGQRPRPPHEGSRPHSGHKSAYAGERGGPRGRNKSRTPRPPAPPKPPREKIPPPPPFVPTPEQIKQVQERYLELAQPIEFDGIRTQIAQELQIPKKAVKQIVKDLRSESHIPSWWELQTYKGSTEELDKIKAVYEPYLPVPPVGVHKLIADQLSIKPSITYQAIKTIRQELGLPQYNDPSLHEHELVQYADEGSSTHTSTPAQPEAETAHTEAPTSSQPESEIAHPAPVPADQTSTSSES